MKINILFAVLFSVLLAGWNLFALNPSRTYKQRPEKFNMKYEEVKVQTEDGAILNVWVFPANVETTKLVLIAHNGEGNMADYLRRVDQFVSIGYKVVIFDWRGYGESSEFEIDNNMYIYPHFLNDMKAMIDYCRKAHVSTFSLYGWGIGGSLSLGVGWNRPGVEKIIADTPFFSLENLEERFSDWDEPMEVPFAGFDKEFEPFYALDNAPGKNMTDVLLIVGSNDILFTPEDMRILQSKQENIIDKEIFVIENPNRKDNFRVDKIAYFSRINEFLGGN